MNHLLDPELERGLATVPRSEVGAETLIEARKLIAGGPAVSTASVERVDHVIAADTGVIVRVHRRRDHSGATPCVLSMHAGGFVVGDVSLDDAKLRRWVTELGWVGVSVGYRLAPEAPFPAAIDDCHAALRWVHDHADELGVDTDRIGSAGLSAGGGLAAALPLLLRERDEPQLAFQLLDSPMLDDRGTTESSRRDDLLQWSRSSNEFGWRSYLGERFGGAVPPHAAPARATDLSGLPPAFVGVGSLDGFLDEDVDYALRLNRAGVPTELHVYPGAPHGFSALRGPAISARAERDQLDWLARRFPDPGS